MKDLKLANFRSVYNIVTEVQSYYVPTLLTFHNFIIVIVAVVFFLIAKQRVVILNSISVLSS